MNVKTIDILNASDQELIALSKENVLSLSLEEMTRIRDYFCAKGRNPTDIELETMAQTWSEHCKHKTLTGIVEYSEYDVAGRRRTRTFNNLLKETVFRATQELDMPWCISVFKDNAGVIDFDDENGIAFKVETHNHPSALEPYGGAATGIGGVIRDILGVGLGAKPLANTDIFCFGPPDLPWSKLPKGVLHPKRIAKGVVGGVRDYGNRMGIPTVNGAVFFDEGYTSNPLVYCGTLGIIPRSKCFKKVLPGDLILVVGGRTGRDGIHGATFSSVQLDQESDVSAVQIGNAIVEKKVLDTLLQARDRGLYRAVTDCGAGGLSSAVGELGEDCGARVTLEDIPLKYAGLKPWEIWLSEAQERMVFAVPPKNRKKISDLFAAENVEATFIGEFTDDHKLTILYEKAVIADLDMEFMHKGVPRPTRKAVWRNKDLRSSAQGGPASGWQSRNYGKDLKSLLSSYNICSKEWIVRQYDHEVQGQTVVKPLQGRSVSVSGPGDAAVIWPYTVTSYQLPVTSKKKKSHYRGVVLSNGLNPEYGKIDPYWMAASAIDEALRNAVCVGADPDKIAVLDNFCWGNPNRPEILGSLVRAALACYDMAKVYRTPFISGKDSLHNEYAHGKDLYSIPPALLISAVGIVPDIRKAVTMDLKEEGNLVYAAGVTRNELGGSHYALVKKLNGGQPPHVDPKSSRALMKALHRAMLAGTVRSCHDCSEGGLSVALAEMCIAGDRGMEFSAFHAPHERSLSETELLFSESNGRFIIEVNPEKQKEFERLMAGQPLGLAGRVRPGDTLTIYGKDGTALLSEKVEELRTSWRTTLDW